MLVMTILDKMYVCLWVFLSFVCCVYAVVYYIYICVCVCVSLSFSLSSFLCVALRPQVPLRGALRARYDHFRQNVSVFVGVFGFVCCCIRSCVLYIYMCVCVFFCVFLCFLCFFCVFWRFWAFLFVCFCEYVCCIC